MSKAMRRLVRPKTLLLSTVILAVFAATALAATIPPPPIPSSGNWTVIGTTGSDTILAGNGNYTILGLGGNDTVNVGNGNNFIEADGECPAAFQDTVTPSPGNFVYCEPDQIAAVHFDTINVGSGNNIIVGGGYSNTINAGNGQNAIYAGGSHQNTVNSGNGPNLIVGGSGPNTINVGNANVNCGSGHVPCIDVVYAGGGPDTINVGSGTSVVFAQNGRIDHINCARGNNATVYADPNDVVSKSCKTVITGDPPSASTPPPATGSALTASPFFQSKAGDAPGKNHSSKAKKHSKHSKHHSRTHSRGGR